MGFLVYASLDRVAMEIQEVLASRGNLLIIIEEEEPPSEEEAPGRFATEPLRSPPGLSVQWDIFLVCSRQVSGQD